MAKLQEQSFWNRLLSWFGRDKNLPEYDQDDPWFEIDEATKNPADADLLPEAREWLKQHDNDNAELQRALLKARNFRDMSLLDALNDKLDVAPGALPTILEVTVSELEIPSNNRNIPARLYIPQKTEKPFPLIIYFHGGGWVSGSLECTDSLCRALSAAVPCKVVSVNYRKAPEYPYPAAFIDALAAFKWACGHAAELTCNRHLIFLGGDDAGGNLAAAVAYQCNVSQEHKVRGAFLYYPIVDAAGNGDFSCRRFAAGYGFDAGLFQECVNCYVPSPKERSLPAVSPLDAASLTRMPPTMIITAQFDILRDQAQAMAERINAADIPVRYRCIPGTLHGFMSQPGMGGIAETAINDTVFFIRKLCGMY